MKLICKSLVVFTIIASLIGCSSSPKTHVVQVGDNELTKQQIINELAKLDETERQIDKNKGVNATNIGAFLFWLPGLAYTYIDANDAHNLVEQRRSHLTNLYNQKYGHVSVKKRAA